MMTDFTGPLIAELTARWGPPAIQPPAEPGPGARMFAGLVWATRGDGKYRRAWGWLTESGAGRGNHTVTCDAEGSALIIRMTSPGRQMVLECHRGLPDPASITAASAFAFPPLAHDAWAGMTEREAGLWADRALAGHPVIKRELASSGVILRILCPRGCRNKLAGGRVTIAGSEPPRMETERQVLRRLIMTHLTEPGGCPKNEKDRR